MEKESEGNDYNIQLWRSPSGSIWAVITVVLLVIISIVKFTTSLTIFKSTFVVRGSPSVNYDVLDIIIYGLWLIGPPLFFLIEYVFIFGSDKQRRLDTKQIADLKYCQELASKIWAGVAVFFSILLLLKYGIKP